MSSVTSGTKIEMVDGVAFEATNEPVRDSYSPKNRTRGHAHPSPFIVSKTNVPNRASSRCLTVRPRHAPRCGDEIKLRSDVSKGNREFAINGAYCYC